MSDVTPRTQTLKLRFGPDATLNQNWTRIDDAVGALQSGGGGGGGAASRYQHVSPAGTYDLTTFPDRAIISYGADVRGDDWATRPASYIFMLPDPAVSLGQGWSFVRAFDSLAVTGNVPSMMFSAAVPASVLFYYSMGGGTPDRLWTAPPDGWPVSGWELNMRACSVCILAI